MLQKTYIQMLLIASNLSEETYTTYQAYTLSKSSDIRQECSEIEKFWCKIHLRTSKKGSKVLYRFQIPTI